MENENLELSDVTISIPCPGISDAPDVSQVSAAHSDRRHLSLDSPLALCSVMVQRLMIAATRFSIGTSVRALTEWPRMCSHVVLVAFCVDTMSPGDSGSLEFQVRYLDMWLAIYHMRFLLSISSCSICYRSRRSTVTNFTRSRSRSTQRRHFPASK